VYRNLEGKNQNLHRCENLKFQHYLYNKNGWSGLSHAVSREKLRNVQDVEDVLQCFSNIGDAYRTEGLCVRYKVTQ
jgi:hypothetical protein